jgi:xanthine dehydrogenase accessory factor
MTLLARLADMIRQDGAAALVTLADVKGSSPREAGARMAVRRDGAFTGTIGGGALEWQALAEAQALLSAEDGRKRVLDRSLGPDLGQCCGGRVRLVIERFGRADLAEIEALAEAERKAEQDQAIPILLFGAGHVGRALALALAPLPVRVTWFDARENAFPSHVPANVEIARTGPAALVAAAADRTAVVVMTHSHALDLEIVAAALEERRFAYVGVIGSETKRRRFVSQLRQAGLSDELIATLVCPIGVPGLDGKEPAIIAASVVVQLLLLREAGSASGEKQDAPAQHLTGEIP